MQKQLIFAAAALAAHSTSQGKGFRQKDVKFMAELFLNWLDAVTIPSENLINNNQVKRFLDDLVDNRFAKLRTSQRKKTYHPTRMGLLDLLQRLSQATSHVAFDDFLFVLYFFKSYGDLLKRLIEQNEEGYPRSFQIEVESLLNHYELKRMKIQQLELAIRRLKARMDETLATRELALKLQRQSEGVHELVKKVSEQYPYDLHSQKPMNELLLELPPEMRIWELTLGNQNRVQVLWNAELSLLESQLRILNDLK